MPTDPTRLRKRSLSIAGHATSVSVEDVFWNELGIIAERDGRSVADIIREIDVERTGNLSSAIRVYVLMRLKTSGSSHAEAD